MSFISKGSIIIGFKEGLSLSFILKFEYSFLSKALSRTLADVPVENSPFDVVNFPEGMDIISIAFCILSLYFSFLILLFVLLASN